MGLGWGILGGHTQSPQDAISVLMFSRKFSESKAVFIGPGMSHCVALGP